MILRPGRRFCAPAGFTMLELLIAVLVLVICLVPLVSLWDVGFHSAEESDRLAQATSLARQEVEAAKNKQFGDIEEGEVLRQVDDYDVQTIITEVEDDWKQIKVKVYRYPRSSYPDAIVELTTYLGAEGV